MTRMLVAGAVLATLAASPAFAQSYDPDLGSGNIVQWNSSTVDTGSVPRSSHARVVPGGAASPYSAYGAVTPFGSPAATRSGGNLPTGTQNTGAGMSAARETAMRECAPMSRRYAESTWGTMQVQQYRTCMAQHGQAE